MEPEALEWGRPAPASSEVDFCEIFAASYRRLVVQLYGVTGDFAEAEDLVQEAFTRGAAAGRRFLTMGNQEAWLRTVAINLQRSRWRKLRNFSRIRERLAGPPTNPPDLDERMDVVDALRSLPPGQREVLALHYLADLDVTQVAQTLGIAEGTVKSRLSRGREALAHILTAQEPDHV